MYNIYIHFYLNFWFRHHKYRDLKLPFCSVFPQIPTLNLQRLTHTHTHTHTRMMSSEERATAHTLTRKLGTPSSQPILKHKSLFLTAVFVCQLQHARWDLWNLTNPWQWDLVQKRPPRERPLIVYSVFWSRVFYVEELLESQRSLDREMYGALWDAEERLINKRWSRERERGGRWMKKWKESRERWMCCGSQRSWTHML